MQNSKFDHSWLNYLTTNQIPVCTEIDTRKLTMKLRQSGTPLGVLIKSSSKEEAISKAESLIQNFKKWESYFLKIGNYLPKIGSYC